MSIFQSSPMPQMPPYHKKLSGNLLVNLITSTNLR